MKSSFVFHDPSGKRWVRFRRALHTSAIFAGLGLFLLGFSMMTSPQLPTIGLPEVERLAGFREVRSIIRGEKAQKNIPFRLQKDPRKIKYVRSASPMLHPKTAARAGPSRPVVFGYYVNWDRASIVSLRLNLQHLTHLVPEWLTLSNGKGDLEDESDQSVIQIAADAKLPILALVTNFREGWQKEDLHRVLTDPDARASLIDNIHSNLAEHKFAGVNIDFEQLQAGDRDRMVEFMRALKNRLKPEGLLVTQSVPVDDPAYDLKRLAAINDYIVPMVYDEHCQSGAPGPVASRDWFESHLEKLAKTLPREKTVIGIPNYGYDWIIGSTGAAEVSFGDVMAAAVKNKAAVEWDADTGNPVLRHTTDTEQHEIWFTDAVTALNQLRAISDAGFCGYGLWRLGAEDPDLWTAVKPESWPEDNFDPAPLTRLAAQKTVNEYGNGEVIRITETPHDGRRRVWRNKDGNFEEKYARYPSYYVIESAGGAQEKTVCLTFDDGPDGRYTPQILDVLKARKVPAAFFVVGLNAEQHPDILKRAYAEGHEIGNHTYSHPNIAATSASYTRLELSATQRIVEHALGVSTILFRPPYNADREPQTPEEILPVLRAQQMNCITVAESIDPRDWEKGTTADEIVKEVIAERENGHIVLLHDGGGDRSATVEALPRIIDYFHGRGYRFVSVAELIGKTRADTMPPPSGTEMGWARIEGEAFGLKSTFTKIAGILFLLAIYLTVSRSALYGALAVAQKFAARRRKFDPAFRPPVSVLIAAYNEERVVRRTVSILDNGYPDLEIVIVDDGSKDRTREVLDRAFGAERRVRIYSQPNGGKSAALNRAIAEASHEVLIALDADTIFRRGTIEKLVRHFADPSVGAVSGNARVGNRGKWITRFQSIEYIYGFNLDRRALDLLNAITVVPGAAGAWRKSLVEKLGGFGHDTLAEDTDLTLAIRRLGYRVRYEEAAVAYTEAPEDTRSLAKQRFRWAFGTLQAVWKHRDATFAFKYGTLGFVALPSVWLFQVFLSALSPFAEVAMLIALIAGNWQLVLLYYFAFFLVEALTGVLAYALEGEKPFDLAFLFFQRIYYRQLMHYVLAKSFVYAIRGRLVGWGKLERRASVNVSAGNAA